MMIELLNIKKEYDHRSICLLLDGQIAIFNYGGSE